MPRRSPFILSSRFFPLLLFLMSVLGLFLDAAEDMRRELFAKLGQIIPGSGSLALIQDTLNEVVEEGGGKLSFGALLARWSASAGIDNIRIALNDVYDLKEPRP